MLDLGIAPHEVVGRVKFYHSSATEQPGGHGDPLYQRRPEAPSVFNDMVVGWKIGLWFETAPDSAYVLNEGAVRGG